MTVTLGQTCVLSPKFPGSLTHPGGLRRHKPGEAGCGVPDGTVCAKPRGGRWAAQLQLATREAWVGARGRTIGPWVCQVTGSWKD